MRRLLLRASFPAAAALLSLNLLLSGCGTSVQTVSSQSADSLKVDSLQSENQRLQAENALLKKNNSQLEQDKRALNAKVADLTSKLGQSSQQWQDLQDLQIRLNTLDSELTAEKQINRDLSAKNADLERQTMTSSRRTIITKAEFNRIYNEGLRFFRARKYSEAEKNFNDLIASRMENILMGNAHYWLGECYYATQRYKDACYEFQKTIAYHKGYKMGAAYVMLGMSYLRLGEKEKAKEAWQNLIAKYPRSKYAVKAKNYLSQL
jgi:tol-pal system protein YbgF